MSRSIFVVAALLLTSTSAQAQRAPYVTKADYVFCTTLSSFNEQSRILASGDKVAWGKFLTDRRNGCAFLKAGVRVHMENARGIGIIKIRPEGETGWFYTNTEAIRRA